MAQAPMQVGGATADPYEWAEGDLHAVIHPISGQVLVFQLIKGGVVQASWTCEGLDGEWQDYLAARHGKRLYVMADGDPDQDGDGDFGGAIEGDLVDAVIEAVGDIVEALMEVLGL